MLNRQSQWIIRLCAAVAGLLWLQMVLYGIIRIFNLPAWANLLDFCNSWLVRWRLPFLALIMDGLIWSTLAISLWLAVRQLLAYARVKLRFHKHRMDSLSRSLAIRHSLAPKKLMMVSSREPLALTMGFIRPVIVVSTGLLELLDEAELEAVLRHEQFHLRKRDSLRTLVTYILSRSLWYLPILRWCHHSFRVWREVLADRYAVAQTGSAAGLGSALLKLARLGPVARMSFAHASFADTPINLRIQSLIDPQCKTSLKPPLVPAMISLHVLAFLTVLLLPAAW